MRQPARLGSNLRQRWRQPAVALVAFTRLFWSIQSSPVQSIVQSRDQRPNKTRCQQQLNYTIRCINSRNTAQFLCREVHDCMHVHFGYVFNAQLLLYWQSHSGLLVGLLMLPPASSRLGLQLSAPHPLSVATQLAHPKSGESIKSLSWLQSRPRTRHRWQCQQGSLYLHVNTISTS